jgi:catechol 2,3-dioxygenase-like lactoylglutathione lyase family enzyme
MAPVSVRYIVDDVDASIAFYSDLLGFEVVMHPAPMFAMLARGDLRLLLSAPSGQGGGGQILADGQSPQPGGWTRFQLEVEDVAAEVERLKQAGAHFRSDVLVGVGGDQALLEDPSGNPIELFQPKRCAAAPGPAEARRRSPRPAAAGSSGCRRSRRAMPRPARPW